MQFVPTSGPLHCPLPTCNTLHSDSLVNGWLLFLLTVFSFQCQLSREALQPLRVSPIPRPLPSPSFHFIHNVSEFDFISLFVLIAKISHQILSSSRAGLYLSSGLPRLKALVLPHTEVRVTFTKQVRSGHCLLKTARGSQSLSEQCLKCFPWPALGCLDLAPRALFSSHCHPLSLSYSHTDFPAISQTQHVPHSSSLSSQPLVKRFLAKDSFPAHLSHTACPLSP